MVILLGRQWFAIMASVPEAAPAKTGAVANIRVIIGTMDQTPFRRLPAFGLLSASLLLAASTGGRAAVKAPAQAPVKTAPAPVEALLYSTMPSVAAHRPEMAMDGDAGTYFRSAYGMGDGDDFLVLLSRPIPVKSLHITTGDADGQDLLTGGFVETSADGVHYTKAASFDGAGVADAALAGAPVAALRIRLNHGEGVPRLVVREVSIQSPAKVSHVQMGPGRGFYDISQAPDLAVWAQKAETQMEESWADTEALLYTDKFIPPDAVNVIYRTGPGVTGVAATGGGVMEVNSAWCRGHADDTGLTVHETAHVIQAYSAYNPVWLVEGIADYVRWVRFEPENYKVRINPKTATYHDSYRTTGAFLAWCELNYDSGLVTKLSRAVRFGNYNTGMFKAYCGKDVDTLWSEFLAAYKADPVNVITPPVAAADRPRVLPAVAPGSSVPVDLSASFSTAGLFSGGAAALETGGVDGEGNGYPAASFGATQTVKGVQFNLGRPDAPDLIACHGQVLPLPAGSHASSLWMLAAAVEGSQMAQTFTVTYKDGTTQTLVQNFSDWFLPGGFPGESRAVKTPYRLTAHGVKDPRSFYVYSYGFKLDGAKLVQSITLPDNANLKVFALSLAN